MSSLSSIHERHSHYQDSLLDTFETHLREIVGRAEARVIGRLQERLSIENGIIESTPRNMLILRNAGKWFEEELDKAGYGRLVNAFVGEFRGTLPFLQETIEYLGEQIDRKWPSLNFTAKDLNLLASTQMNAVASLNSVMSAVSGQAMSRGLFGLAGLRFGDLVETLTEKLGTSISQARTIADTSMSAFYRTATDRAFQVIAKDLPEQELQYRYSGPVDLLERPFCRHLTDVDKAYTREQIDQMDNGQLPNTWITCGGWNCRHSWILDLESIVDDAKEPAVARKAAA